MRLRTKLGHDMNNDKPLKLKIPAQTRDQFDHFQLNRDAALEWAQQLPVANTPAVAKQLLSALIDLNHCKLSPELRYEILQALSGNLQVTLTNLSKRFLHQPLVMPQEPRQLAELTDDLYTQLTTAYSIVAVQIVGDPDSVRESNPARLLCASLQAGLVSAGRSILLAFQLYRPVDLDGWLTLHQLYSLAERQGLATLAVNGEDGAQVTITDTYLPTLILGCAKPNQLRQSDMVAVYRALAEWSNMLEIGEQGAVDGLFLVDLDSDQPPLYSALYGNQEGGRCRYINTETLVIHLKNLRERDDARGKPGLKLKSGVFLPSNMLSHLIDCLGSMSMRNFGRVPSEAPLLLSAGLSAAHYHTAGEKDFELLLYGQDYVPPAEARLGNNPFLHDGKSGQDPWRKANPEKDFVREEAATEGEAELSHRVELDEQSLRAINEGTTAEPAGRNYPVHRLYTINASPGGYCLRWIGDTPDSVRAGNVTAIKEEPGDAWSIAVIRWVSQLQNSDTLLGLELLSPQALAYGALIHSKKGQVSEPQRVLLLPEIKLVGQPHTLITPRSGFRERQKITLLRLGETFYIQLTRQIAATAGYAQFDFRYIKHPDEVMAEDKSGPLDSSYDSLWSNI